MKSGLKYLGLVLIAVGVVLMMGLHLYALTMFNMLTLIPLLLILAGTFLYVFMLKRESKY